MEEGTITVAYLGPKGTYGHQAAAELIARIPCPSHASSSSSTASIHQYRYIPCPTIPSIYTSIADYLVMPLQNTIHGGVLETLDSLLSVLQAVQEGDEGLRGRGRPMIVDSVDLGIRHCLVARRGTKMEDIRWVRSHEQALGQSSAFLSQHLPRAKRESWPSTAGAAASLVADISNAGSGLVDVPPDAHPSEEDVNGASKRDERVAMAEGFTVGATVRTGGEADGGGGLGSGAAICSRAAIKEYPELEVLYEGTQGIENNYTRFLLLSRSSHARTPTSGSGSGLGSLASSVPSSVETNGVERARLTSHSSGNTNGNVANIVNIANPSHLLSGSSPTGRIRPREDTHTRFYALSSPADLGVLASHGEIITVHSRPSTTAVPARTSSAKQAAEMSAATATPNRYPVSLFVELRPYPSYSTDGDASSPAAEAAQEGGGESIEREGIVYLGAAPSDSTDGA